MDIVPIVLGFTVATIMLSILGIAAFGVKNIIAGKHDFMKVGAVLVPFVLFGISMGVRGDSAEAGILTILSMILLLAAFVLFSGLRRTFKF